MEFFNGPFWGPSCFCYTPPIWTRSSLTTGLCRTFYADESGCIILSSGSNRTAADRPNREHYGYRLMDEVEQAATDSCKNRVSLACNTASTSLFQRQSFQPWQHHRQAHQHGKKSGDDDESVLLNEVPHQETGSVLFLIVATYSIDSAIIHFRRRQEVNL